VRHAGYFTYRLSQCIASLNMRGGIPCCKLKHHRAVTVTAHASKQVKKQSHPAPCCSAAHASIAAFTHCTAQLDALECLL
jgi:hypothetical protein